MRFGRGAPAPVVVPGSEKVAMVGDCDACRLRGLLVRIVVDGIELVVCLDPVACSERYRNGVSPATYAAGLRGELLAVAL